MTNAKLTDGCWIKPTYEYLNARWQRRSTKAVTSNDILYVCIHWPIDQRDLAAISATPGATTVEVGGKHRFHKWGWARRGCLALKCGEWLILIAANSAFKFCTTSHLSASVSVSNDLTWRLAAYRLICRMLTELTSSRCSQSLGYSIPATHEISKAIIHYT